MRRFNDVNLADLHPDGAVSEKNWNVKSVFPFTGNPCGIHGDAEEKSELIRVVIILNSNKCEKSLQLETTINVAPLSSYVFDCCTVFDI